MARPMQPIPEPPQPEGSLYFTRPRASATLVSAAIVWLSLTVLLLGYGFYQAIVLAPTEATMGNVQRIFYWHVPSAMLGLIFPYVNLAASLAFLYLRRKNPLAAMTADAVAVASAEVSVLFTTICLGTGMLWGRASWGIWWAWDARLTSVLLLWLLYVAYLLVRRMAATGQTATVGAVLSVFAAIDVPIVYYSIQWWRTQHPSPVLTGDGNMDPAMWRAFGWNSLAWALWGIFILVLRYQLERRRQHGEMEATLESLEASLDPPAGFGSSHGITHPNLQPDIDEAGNAL